MKYVATQIRQLYRTFLEFEYEINATYKTIVVPLWSQPPWRNRLPHVLYGCMMWSSAWVDRLSSLWRGEVETRGQSKRMADFFETYLGYDRAVASFAIKLWRHTLVHTAEPRALSEMTTDLEHRWLLHWGPELPREQHMTITSFGKTRILNMALLHLVADLKSGQRDFFRDIYRRSDLQQNLLKAEKKLSIVSDLKMY
jgi:hypothetical protein